VALIVYDVRGARVRTLVNGRQPAGVKQVVWDAKNDRGIGVASGVYFCRMTAPGFAKTRKIVLRH
jgi:flagellar hook assembly protein FlgD